MLIAVFALFSWIFTFDSRDGNDGVKKVEKKQNIKIININNEIVVCKNGNNNFVYQGTDNYRLNLYHLNNIIEKEEKHDLYSIDRCIDDANEPKRNKALIRNDYITKDQELLVIEYRINLCSQVLEKEYFKKRWEK